MLHSCAVADSAGKTQWLHKRSDGFSPLLPDILSGKPCEATRPSCVPVPRASFRAVPLAALAFYHTQPPRQGAAFSWATVPTSPPVGSDGVPKHLPGSALAMDDAIGRYRAALAELLGCSPDTIDLWCTPPPGFTPDSAHNRGRRNPIDELYTIARRCPDGLHAIRWLAEQLGFDLVAKHAPAETGQLPIADATLVVAAVEKLALELRRRKPRLTPDGLLDLRDSLTEGIHALVNREIERRKAKESHRA